MYKLYDINVALDTLKCFLLLLLLLLLVHSIVRGPLFLVTPRATKNSRPGLGAARIRQHCKVLISETCDLFLVGSSFTAMAEVSETKSIIAYS